MKINVSNPEQVVKRMFWLAYKACRGPSGMGILQARDDATEETVWQNVQTAGDYGVGAGKIMGSDKPGVANGDYVFGRMMKLSVDWDAESITIRDTPPRRDYQPWSDLYKTYEELANAAISSVG